MERKRKASNEEGGAYPLPPRLAEAARDLPGEPLAFTPAPVKARHDGWTAPRQQGFIVRLALCGCVTTAARGVGMSAKSAYDLRKRAGAASFAAAWDAALGIGANRMSDLAIVRAISGETRPIFYQGRQIGERVRYHEGLVIAVLRRFDPKAPRTLGWND